MYSTCDSRIEECRHSSWSNVNIRWMSITKWNFLRQICWIFFTVINIASRNYRISFLKSDKILLRNVGLKQKPKTIYSSANVKRKHLWNFICSFILISFVSRQRTFHFSSCKKSPKMGTEKQQRWLFNVSCVWHACCHQFDYLCYFCVSLLFSSHFSIVVDLIFFFPYCKLLCFMLKIILTCITFSCILFFIMQWTKKEEKNLCAGDVWAFLYLI